MSLKAVLKKTEDPLVKQDLVEMDRWVPYPYFTFIVYTWLWKVIVRNVQTLVQHMSSHLRINIDIWNFLIFGINIDIANCQERGDPCPRRELAHEAEAGAGEAQDNHC